LQFSWLCGQQGLYWPEFFNSIKGGTDMGVDRLGISGGGKDGTSNADGLDRSAVRNRELAYVRPGKGGAVQPGEGGSAIGGSGKGKRPAFPTLSL
jgi:hypothetical protein